MSTTKERKAYNADLKVAIGRVAETHPEINLSEMERQLRPIFAHELPSRPTLAKVMQGQGWIRHPDGSCAGAYYERPA
jgi:hypothetical protein